MSAQEKLIFSCLAASILSRQSAKRIVALLSDQDKSAILNEVNNTRRKLGVSEFSWREPKKVITDWEKLLISDARKLSNGLYQSLDRKEVWLFWKAFIHSKPFSLFSLRHPIWDECADLLIGLDERQVQREAKRQPLPWSYRRENTYLDLTPEELFTPYTVISHMLKRVRPLCIKTKGPPQPPRFIDLGCGLARVGFSLAAAWPNVEFIGYEIVADRVRTVRRTVDRFGLEPKIKMYLADLFSDTRQLESGDVYFLFNPFSEKTLRHVLKKIKAVAPNGALLVTVLHGRPLQIIRNLSWLHAISSEIHFPDWRGRGYQIFRIRK